MAVDIVKSTKEVTASPEIVITNQDTLFPVANQFSGDIYARTIFMPKGAVVVGKKHLKRHFNFIMTGKAMLWMNGVLSYVEAPCLLESLEGVRKVLYIEEDMHWTTVHSTDTYDIEEIEAKVVATQSIEEVIEELNKYNIRIGE